MKKIREYKELEDLSDSEEELHPNIDMKSYRKFIKEQRVLRFEELKSKTKLSQNEQEELEVLEYKFLPVVKEVCEDNFRTSKDEELRSEDYLDDLNALINYFTLKSFIELLERKNLNLSVFEELVDVNLVECIKTNNDEVGLVLCKIGLCTKWARSFGKVYLIKLSERENQLEEIIFNNYEASKKAILDMSKE